MSVRFDQDSAAEYEFCNGKKPRGYGGWVFYLRRDGAVTSVAYTGTYTWAKKQAMAEARGLGCESVSVAS